MSNIKKTINYSISNFNEKILNNKIQYERTFDELIEGGGPVRNQDYALMTLLWGSLIGLISMKVILLTYRPMIFY